MKCPECGATLKKISKKCTECGALLKRDSDTTSAQPKKVELTPAITLKQPDPRLQNPSLIEFPGINRNALPEWRKELSERVREKQERRAREAVLEAQPSMASTVDSPPAAVP